MGWLDPLEKLINEHGSAAILRERISLANDQYAALERRRAELEKQNAALQEENATLKSERDRLAADNERLREQNLSLYKQSTPVHDVVSLDDTAEGMLKVMANAQWTAAAPECLGLRISQARVDYYIDMLSDAGLISRVGWDLNNRLTFAATPAGRKYLAKKDLL